MKVSQRITIGILTKQPLSQIEDGEAFLALLLSEFSELAPEFYGNYEPIRLPFQCSREAARFWKTPFLWKRNTPPRLYGSVWMDNPGAHSAIYIRIPKARASSYPVMVNFLQSFSIRLDADFSYLNMTTQNEVDFAPHERWHPFDVGVTTHDLKRGIPALPWATILGHPYISSLPKDALMQSPAYLAKRLSARQVYLQFTSDIRDLEKNYAQFMLHRTNICNHLHSLFYGAEEPMIPQDLLTGLPEAHIQKHFDC